MVEVAIVHATVIKSQSHPEQILEIAEDGNEDDNDLRLSVPSLKDKAYAFKAICMNINKALNKIVG
ncbi:MAG: hypothetical protein ACOYK1_04685 [Vampirovibrionia bacterium]